MNNLAHWLHGLADLLAGAYWLAVLAVAALLWVALPVLVVPFGLVVAWWQMRAPARR